MPPEVLKRNQKMCKGEIEPEASGRHLGLYNSLKRLKYFYGTEAAIEVESEEGEMTSFTIRFPYDLEEL